MSSAEQQRWHEPVRTTCISSPSCAGADLENGFVDTAAEGESGRNWESRADSVHPAVCHTVLACLWLVLDLSLGTLWLLGSGTCRNSTWAFSPWEPVESDHERVILGQGLALNSDFLMVFDWGPVLYSVCVWAYMCFLHFCSWGLNLLEGKHL